MTGSGKTNLAICICNQLLSYKIPFLVIEPSGSTWRTFLLSPENLNYHGQVFTAGDNSVSPFKFNPLQIMEGVNPFSHIESLVSIFTESFSLPPFASKILGQALKNLYVERGWDLNATMDEPSARSNLDRVNLSTQVQPTLRDLVDLLSTIADTFDVSGELETAKFFPSSLADFVLGSGGSLFDSSESISPDQLFQYPTVVELKTFSKKSEKSILVKLLLLFLSEYKQSNNSGVVILQHVLLVEDAGLATSSLNSTRIAGEGLIAIEQCPSRLPLEFLTNACVKVAHRVVAVDDRDSMAFCMHLDNLQDRSLTALGQGRSIVSSAVHEGKYHLALQFDNSQSYPPPDTPEESDEFVRAAMKNRNKPC